MKFRSIGVIHYDSDSLQEVRGVTLGLSPSGPD
jgi:hypothetical protein